MVLLHLLLLLLVLIRCTCYTVTGRTLLEIKKSFRNADDALHDWSGDGAAPGYCSWRGVLCDGATFAVAAL
jgi:hypothetical protein